VRSCTRLLICAISCIDEIAPNAKRSFTQSCSGGLIIPALICVSACILLLASTQPQAQTHPSTSSRLIAVDTEILEEIEIIGNTGQAPRTGEVVGSEHTGSVATIGRERLAQPGAQLGDLLGAVSGVQQRQSGGFGTFATISMRSSSAAQTAVYLDGILLNTGGESAIDLSSLEILNLASVDLYKGTTPLQLGHAGMGGAVNLNSMNSSGDKGTRLRLGIGSFSYGSLMAAQQGSKDKWDWTATVARQQSDNDYRFTNNMATPLNSEDDETQRRTNNHVSRTSLLLKSGYQRTSEHRTDVLLQIAERDLGIPTARNSATNKASYKTEKTQFQLSQIIDQWYGWNSRHSLYWHQSNSIYDDSQSSVGLGRQLIDTDIRTLGIKSYWERFSDIGTYGLSVDIRDEALNLEDKLNTEEDFTADQLLLLSAVHMAITDENERWLITPAFRWQTSQRRGTSSSIGVTQSLPTQNESEHGAQLGVAYSLTPSFTVNANVGNYFRVPSFNELFGSIGLVNGNPTLVPEKGVNAGIGVKYEADSLQLEAVLFKNNHDELILNSFDARGIGRPRNTGKAEITGVELSAQWTPLPRWTISASATFQNPRNQDPFNGHKNKMLPGISRRTSFARLSHDRGKLGYWYEWQAARERFYDSTNLLPAADTSLHSAGIDWTDKRWHVSARLQNLGDDVVEDYNGFPKPGRSIFLTLTHEL